MTSANSTLVLSTFHLGGIATDEDGAPVTGAKVIVYPWLQTRRDSIISQTDDAPNTI